MTVAEASSAPFTLCYHRISRRPLPAGTWVTPGQLEAHLSALQGAGAMARVTFDDATVDLHEHRQILIDLDITPLVFVPADLLGKRNSWEWGIPGRGTRHLTGAELRDLVDLGWEVGLHGASHRDLTRCDDRRLADELSGGRKRLEDVAGIPVRSLSYPYGRCDDRVVAAVRAAGLSAAYVLAANVGTDPLRRPRRPVYCIDSVGDVLSKWRDPQGRTWAGRWQRWKEAAAHGVGRWTVAGLGSPAADDRG